MWINGVKSSQRRIRGWSTDVQQRINDYMAELNTQIPTEIHRATRSFNHLNYWKGSEYRTFLLYIGIVVLKDHLPLDQYEHFLELFCAVSICYSSAFIKYRIIAKQLFEEFVDNYIIIYGRDSIVSNVHNLCHIVDDVERFGNLNNISTYEFENALGQLKLWLRRCDKPLEQISRRIIEHCSINQQNWKPPNIDIFSPSVKYSLEGEAGVYKHLNIKPNVILSCRKYGDKFFLSKSNEIVELNYIVEHNGSFTIVGDILNNDGNFFNEPLSSQHLKIYLSAGKKIGKKEFSLECFESKLICLTYQENFVFVPLHHSFD